MLVHSQSFTKNHFHFLSVLESVISGVLLQQHKQVKVDCRVDGPEVPNELVAATPVPAMWDCIVMLNITQSTVYLFGSLKQH
jgi:hypothetical protein